MSSSIIKFHPTMSLATEGYWRGPDLWGTDDFAGYTLENCIEVIHSDIVGVWDFPDNDEVCLFSPSWLFCLLKEISTCRAKHSEMISLTFSKTKSAPHRHLIEVSTANTFVGLEQTFNKYFP